MCFAGRILRIANRCCLSLQSFSYIATWRDVVMHRFENLEIWKIAQDYGNRLYIVSRSFPREELFALSDQLKRAAVSISSNIAEGSGGTRKEFAHFLIIAVRSALETVNILHFAQSQGYITQEVRLELYEESDKLIRKIRAFKNSLSIV